MAYRKEVVSNISYDEGDYSRLGLDDWKFQWDAIQAGYKLSPCKTILSQYRVFRDANGNIQTTAQSNRSEEEVLKIKDAYIDRITNNLTPAK